MRRESSPPGAGRPARWGKRGPFLLQSPVSRGDMQSDGSGSSLSTVEGFEADRARVDQPEARLRSFRRAAREFDHGARQRGGELLTRRAVHADHEMRGVKPELAPACPHDARDARGGEHFVRGVRVVAGQRDLRTERCSASLPGCWAQGRGPLKTNFTFNISRRAGRQARPRI
jgi:hypothetical protein